MYSTLKSGEIKDNDMDHTFSHVKEVTSSSFRALVISLHDIRTTFVLRSRCAVTAKPADLQINLLRTPAHKRLIGLMTSDIIVLQKRLLCGCLLGGAPN